MKRIKITISIVVFCAFAWATYKLIKKNALTVTPPTTTLIVGTSDDYPPYTFNKDGQIVGFDIDLARAVAQQLGMAMELKNMSFDILLLELQKGRIHVLAAGLTPTKERALRVNFTTPYLQGDPLLTVTRIDGPSITSISEMARQRIIVNEGYTADFYISSHKDLIIERVETVAQAILALRNHKADVFVIAKNALQPFLKTKFHAEFKTETLTDITETYALAVSKKYPELLSKIDKALEGLAQDGTLETLKRKWELS